ncbi:hypothetical protein, partial [Rhodoferax sp.]|uniref:hypothetical protein n=1 Tax=Rhodoferax sp. TaxID=50421 RepID=UPI003BB7017C
MSLICGDGDLAAIEPKSHRPEGGPPANAASAIAPCGSGALAAMATPYIGRFAPSPTGPLHA